MLWKISVWCQDTNLDAANEQKYYNSEQMEKHVSEQGQHPRARLTTGEKSMDNLHTKEATL